MNTYTQGQCGYLEHSFLPLLTSVSARTLTLSVQSRHQTAKLPAHKSSGSVSTKVQATSEFRIWKTDAQPVRTCFSSRVTLEWMKIYPIPDDGLNRGRVQEPQKQSNTAPNTPFHHSRIMRSGGEYQHLLIPENHRWPDIMETHTSPVFSPLSPSPK